LLPVSGFGEKFVFLQLGTFATQSEVNRTGRSYRATAAGLTLKRHARLWIVAPQNERWLLFSAVDGTIHVRKRCMENGAISVGRAHETA
jgi:hypothetical protein